MHTSFAERIAYGTPLEPEVDDTPIHVVPRSGTALVGRILMSIIFLTAGIAKLADPAGAIGYMHNVGVPNAEALVYVAGFAEVLGGLSLLFGFLARVGAIGLTIYLGLVIYYFHGFWALEGQEAKTQLVQATKNLAIIGGLLLVVAFGAGRYSVDGRMRRPMTP